jgi:hypothetical protein
LRIISEPSLIISTRTLPSPIDSLAASLPILPFFVGKLLCLPSLPKEASQAEIAIDQDSHFRANFNIVDHGCAEYLCPFA